MPSYTGAQNQNFQTNTYKLTPKAMTLSEKHRNITRYNPTKYPGYKNGWNVRICWKNKFYRRMFNDDDNGGKWSALLCAIAWRDKTKNKIGMPITEQHCIGVAKSNTGEVGITWQLESQKFSISWVDAAGKPGHTTVSSAKIGYKKAFVKAKAKRAEKEEWRLNGNLQQSRPRHIRRDFNTYTKEELINHLIESHKRLKRLPTSRDFKKIRPATHRFETAFGGWNKALIAAGLLATPR